MFSLYDGLPPPNDAKEKPLKVPTGWSLETTAIELQSEPPSSKPANVNTLSDSVDPTSSTEPVPPPPQKIESTRPMTPKLVAKTADKSLLQFQPTRLLQKPTTSKVHAITSKLITSVYESYNPSHPNDYLEFKRNQRKRTKGPPSKDSGSGNGKSLKSFATSSLIMPKREPPKFGRFDAQITKRPAPLIKNNTFTIQPNLDGVPMHAASHSVVCDDQQPRTGDEAYLRRLAMSRLPRE